MYPNFYDPRMMNPMARFAFPGMARATPFMGNNGLPMQGQPMMPPQSPGARAPMAFPMPGTPETGTNPAPAPIREMGPPARAPMAFPTAQNQMRRPISAPFDQAPPTGGINSLRGYALR